MSVQVEKLEHNMVKLTIEVEAALFDAACEKVYNKEKGKYSLPGFRKGKVPMNVLERTYGAGIFYEDAANDLMPKAYDEALDEAAIAAVSRPDVELPPIGKSERFIYTATLAVKPEVTLGQYKGLDVTKVIPEVSEEEIEGELKKAQGQNAREITVEDRPVKEGDNITLDYEGTIDGVPFDGGTAQSQKLEIGSHSFIDTFEDQLVGLNIGDEKDVEVTFPEDYHAQDLAGKPATFHVKILGITEKQLPEIDDDFAQDTTEFDSLEEYKEDIKAKLLLGKEEQSKSALENELLEKVVDNSEMDIPDAMIDAQVEQMVQEFEQRVTYQGITFDQYMQYTGQDLAALEESMRPDALKQIQGSLVLGAIVDAESIEATDEDLKKEFERMAASYQMEVEQIAGYMQEEEKESMKRNIAVQKAVDFLVEQANITETESLEDLNHKEEKEGEEE